MVVYSHLINKKGILSVSSSFDWCRPVSTNTLITVNYDITVIEGMPV